MYCIAPSFVYRQNKLQQFLHKCF